MGYSPGSDQSPGACLVPGLRNPWPGGTWVSALPWGNDEATRSFLGLLVCSVGEGQTASLALDLLLPGLSNNLARPTRAPAVLPGVHSSLHEGKPSRGCEGDGALESEKSRFDLDSEAY